MMEWTAGYVADIGYTYGYYNELNPLRIKLAFLHQGLAFPEVGTACELGFGQGLSTNIHAAASMIQWYGTDFNPSQAAFARELAAESGVSAQLYDDAFADFLHRADLPDFDYICIHGIWSWISDDNRQVLVEFIRRKLKVGGVLYISYNTFPGWAAFAPMRHLLTEHAEVIGAEGHGIVSRIDGALEFADKLLALNPAYVRANPRIKERAEKLKGQNRHYLAHEYFNRDWQPMHFATMAQCLAPAKLQFACSANYIDHVDLLNLTDDQRTFLQELTDPIFHQSVRDFIINQQFRRDYWIKGARRLTSLDQLEAIRNQAVVLISHRPDISLKAIGALGELTMTATIYDPILEFLADHQPKTIGQIEQAVQPRGINFAQTLQAMLILSGSGHIDAVQNRDVIEQCAPQTERLNRSLCRKARSSSDISFLASPVTGGGVAVPRFQQLFLHSLCQGRTDPEVWVQDVWQILTVQGQKLIKEGHTIETAEDNLSELKSQANEFIEKKLPILKALQIA